MRTPTTIRVNDDLAAGQTCIALWPSDDELARGINVQMREVTEERDRRLPALEDYFLQRLLDNLLYNELIISSMLGAIISTPV